MENKLQAAVFIDRDGVLNRDKGYVSTIDNFEFTEGAIEACKLLKEKGYLLVLITNQSGIARGYYSEEEFQQLTEWMDWSLIDKGAEFDGIYYCPHHLEGKGEYKVDCQCRKPKPGMILNAQKDLNIDLESSVLVGDKISDVMAGITAGIKRNYLVETGKEITEEGRSLATDVVSDLLALAELL